MRSKYVACAILIAAVLLAASGCIAQDNGAAPPANLSVPKENLPEGFKLIATLDSSTKGVNMTDEISKFYGAKDIGPANAVVGIYQWAPMGQGYDSKVTEIALKDEAHAEAAISNYISQDRFKQPPAEGVRRFGPAIINNHNATEIIDRARENSLRFLYLWNHGSTVILVEGNNDRSKSLELASATGL